MVAFEDFPSGPVGFPHSSVSKESACSAGDPSLIPGWGRSPGEGNGNPFQYSCHGQRSLGATAHGVSRVGHDLATKPVVKTVCSQCGGPEFDPWLGNQDLTCHVAKKL